MTSLQEQEIAGSAPLQLLETVIAGRKAKNIYCWMQLRAIDGRVYEVWNVYVARETIRISVSAVGWWNPQNVLEWLDGTKGEGMCVLEPVTGETGVIQAVQPNRACHVLFPNGRRQSYREENLQEQNPIENEK